MTYKDEARSSQSDKAKRMLGSETDTAAKIAADEGSQTSTVDKAKKRAYGGKVEGVAAAKRLDKPARRASGGRVAKGKGKTTVNVIVSPQGGQSAPPAAMPLPPAPPPIAPPAGLSPGAGAPPPGMPPRPPMAGPPGGAPVPPMAMRANGGAVKSARFHVYNRDTGAIVGGANTRIRARATANKKDLDYGASKHSVRLNADHPDNAGLPDTGFKRGGAVKMDAGAGSGVGRLEKSHAA